jgi:hypothetical protein
MVEAMLSLNARLEQENGIRLAICLGIHTGLAVVGEIGTGARQVHMALGEVPNIASHIEGMAKPGTVAISTATYQLVQGYFVCEDLGQHALKGVGQPQHIYQVVRPSGAHGRLDVATMRGLTPLVGRQQEVGLLLDRWRQVKDGMGQVVGLSGEAGIGKSRLVQVLKDQVVQGPHVLWECHSSPYYQQTSLFPLIEFFPRALQWLPDDSPAEKVVKLEHTLRQYRLPLQDTVPLLGALWSLPLPESHYPPLRLSPQRRRQKTLESIVAIMLAQAEQQPVLFILEDLHWTDPTTLEFLHLLIDQTPTASILVLFTYRLEFQPTWGIAPISPKSHSTGWHGARVPRWLNRSPVARDYLTTSSSSWWTKPMACRCTSKK